MEKLDGNAKKIDKETLENTREEDVNETDQMVVVVTN